MTAAALIASLETRPLARRATFYASKTRTIRVSRPHRARRGERSTTFVVTVGKPNYRDRQRLKARQKVGYVHFDMWPAKRKK